MMAMAKIEDSHDRKVIHYAKRLFCAVMSEDMEYCEPSKGWTDPPLKPKEKETPYHFDEKKFFVPKKKFDFDSLTVKQMDLFEMKNPFSI